MRRAVIICVLATLGSWGGAGSSPPATSAKAVSPSAGGQPGRVLFTDDFESGLGRWDIVAGQSAVTTIDSGQPEHGGVMLLETGGDVLALARGSESWGAVRLEADVLFPTDIDNYLGVAYNVRAEGNRLDFGLIYLKGNDGYLQANPHRDFNVSRTLYPEYVAPLEGAAAVRAGEWVRIRVEIAGAECHFYVGDMDTPQMTFPLFEVSSGRVGLQPRSVGGPVWVDNVRVTSIDRLRYTGPPRPEVPDTPAPGVLTTWQVLGPLERTRDEVARQPDAGVAWTPFATDARGAVVTGRVVDFHGPRTVAYFRTAIESDTERNATLHFSSVDDLAVWVNGRFHWFVPRGARAWPDFTTSEEHAGRRIPITLRPGSNDLVVRVRGGAYASGGFFAAIE